MDSKNSRSFIIHLVLSTRTYILSASNIDAFNEWIGVFYRYTFGDVLVESMGWKQSEKKRSYKKSSYKQRYLVLTQYQQIRVYTDEQRAKLHGIISVNDVHSFNIEDITDKKA